MSLPATLPITALVVSRNEAPLLRRCLPSIAFCEEIIVVDLESDDDTREVAAAHGARLIPHELVPIGEWARVDAAPLARHDWLLFLDPDEEVTAGLVAEIARRFPELDDEVGVVFAPSRFFFGSEPLAGTIWGGVRSKRLLVRRSAVELTPTIWGGTRLREGFRVLELTPAPGSHVLHHWVSGYRDWIRKHRRYLALEPVDRADAGELTGYRELLSAPWRSFGESYLAKRGYRDGPTGLALSLLWAWFRTRAELGLLRELRRRARS